MSFLSSIANDALSNKTLAYRVWLHKLGLLETDDIMVAVQYNFIRYRNW